MGYRHKPFHVRFTVLTVLFSLLANFVPAFLWNQWLGDQFRVPQAQAGIIEGTLDSLSDGVRSVSEWLPWTDKAPPDSLEGDLYLNEDPDMPVELTAETDSLSGSVIRDNPGGGLSEIRSVGSVETRYGLVVILVEDDVLDGTATGGSGLFSFLGNTSVGEKIERYAEDVQDALPWTKTLIVAVEDEDSTVEIQKMLELFYYEGNPDDNDPTFLTGVVVVGDVPLPVVNKDGHRFVSVLPYTDFEAPTYVLDESTLDFIPNSGSVDQQADVWHGLIIPPVDDEDTRMDMFASFFDKNHAFHSGDEEYTDFAEKVFVGDYIREQEVLNPVSLDSYDRFLGLWEELYYNQYSSDLLEEVYLEMLGDAYGSGDGLDNDGDGKIDEEAEDGVDNDFDGYIDEDLGDDFFGIDNDGDCLSLDESQQDSNGDGKRCGGGEYDEDGNELVAPDNGVDEDGFDDNNNDKNWDMAGLRESDGGTWKDQMVDEDPPGDLNGDGCPGVCGVDDSGLTTDHDGDGYPTFWEILYGYDWASEKRPWKRVSKMTNELYGTEFETNGDGDDEATQWLIDQYLDNLFGDYYQHESCIFDGVFRPEYSDDTDFFCDEDGSTENRVWANDSGTPYSGSCAYNDADCDGQVDEDPLGTQPQAAFDLIPDILTKDLLWGLLSRYVELYDQPQGVWNRQIDESGRYETRSSDASDIVVNQYDTAISLIAKKDEQTLLYLGYEINDFFEEQVDEYVESIQVDVPMIAVMQLRGEITYTEGEGEDEERVTEEICDDGKAPERGDACLQYVNHSTTSEGKKFSNYGGAFSDGETNNLFIYGRNLWEVNSVAQCSLHAGTNEEGGQLTEFNELFSINAMDYSKSDVIDRNACVVDFAEYRDDIPELCEISTVTAPIRDVTGSTLAENLGVYTEGQIDNFDIGFSSCYEFKEMVDFHEYIDANQKFNKWLSKKLRRFRKNPEDDDEEEEERYEEFLDKVDDKISETGAGTLPFRSHISTLDIIGFDKEDNEFTYTVEDLLLDRGYEDPDGDDFDILVAQTDDSDPITVNNPQYGSGSKMGDVTQIKIYIDKLYVEADPDSLNNRETKGEFTEDRDDAYGISSMYKHVMPTATVISKQYEAQATPDLPIDKTRRVSFMYEKENEKWSSASIEYLNAYEVSSVEEFEAQVSELIEDFNDLNSELELELEDFMSEVNRDQLEDSIEWMHMNLDEKHEYIFSHFLGEEYAIFGEETSGYEMASIISDGTPQAIYYGYNGGEFEESDLEHLHGSQEAIDDALSASATDAPQEELISGQSFTTPVLLTEWLAAIQEWLLEVKDSVSSFDTYGGGGLYCATEKVESVVYSDEDGDGVSDNAENTVAIEISTEQTGDLQVNVDTYIVSVRAVDSSSAINTEDNDTKIRLDVIVGGNIMEFYGPTQVQLTDGIGNFALVGLDPGDFTVQANAVNRTDLADSNTLSGVISDKIIKVSSYVTDIEGSEAVTEDGELVEIYDDRGQLVAVIDPTTGEIDLRIGEVILEEARDDLPTRATFIEDSRDPLTDEYASVFIIPEEKKIRIGEGIEGVFVNEVVDADGLGDGGVVLDYDSSPDDEVLLYVDGTQMGLVNAHGQIIVGEDYSLAFSNPAEANIYEPVQIVNNRAETLFTVTIEHNINSADILEDGGAYEDYVSELQDIKNDRQLAGWSRFSWSIGQGFNWALGFIAPSVSGQTLIQDSDADLLDDLEEWTIGTELDSEDTDADGFSDGQEVFSGYSPWEGGGEKLFTDIDASHEAYYDLATLYLRGIISGYSDGSFRPDDPMKREDFVKVNLGAICINCTNFSSNYEDDLMASYYVDPFPDTPDINSELLACVAQAEQDGIVSGYEGGDEDGYFLPQRNINPAEATKVLIETGQQISYATGADLSVETEVVDGLPWYFNYILTAQENGLFPEGISTEVDTYSRDAFETWLELELSGEDSGENSGVFKSWLEGEITRIEFVQMAVNLLEASDCREIDSDGEGLSDAEEETLYGTDPNEEDTDHGGVNDLDEILRGTDPLDASDDLDTGDDGDGEEFSLDGFEHESGLYVVSDLAEYESILISDAVEEAEVKNFIYETPADGETLLYVQAEIRDQEDEIYIEDNTSVIEFVLSTEEHGEILSRKVQVSEGQAHTSFVGSQVAGDVSIEARLVNGSLPSQDALVKVYPGEPSRVEIEVESEILPVGGESATDVRVSLYDVFGNLANNGFYTVTIESVGSIELLDLFDEDTDTPGTQVTTPDGFIDFRMLSSTIEETASLSASILEFGDGGDSVDIEHIDGMELQIATTQSYMPAGGASVQTIDIRAIDSLGAIVDGFNGDVNLSMSDPSYGMFAESTISLINGEGIAGLVPGTRAGTGSILAESAGLEGGSIGVLIRPDQVVELRIRKTDDGSVLEAGETESFYIEGFDQYGNLVTTDSSTSGTIRMTDMTDEFGRLNTSSFTLNQGVASFSVILEDISGQMNLVASSTGVDEPGRWGGAIQYSVTSEEFSEIESDVLYLSLLGAAYGDVTQEDYIGGWMTFNGRTQAITSLISEPVPKQRMVIIDASGKIDLPPESLLTQTVSGAAKNLPLRIQWRDFPDDNLVGELFYVLDGTRSYTVNEDSATSNDGLIEMNLVSSDPSLELDVSANGDLLLREDDSAAFKIRSDGQIILLDALYSMTINSAAEGLGLVLIRGSENVASIDFNTPWDSSVEVLDSDYDLNDWSTQSAGLYLKPTADHENNIVSVPSGNSTANAQGVAIVNPDEDLSENMQPSMGYPSLESAEDNGNIGWENENKHLLLFAAGNTVGQSNLYYGSEVGVVLGDPTIALELDTDDINELGYTSDLGTMVSAGSEEILRLLEFDYNGDDKPDVLAAYEDGTIRLLQNADSAVRLDDRGALLQIESGISDIDSGDVNGDGLEDLIIVTEESCFADEMCLYIYENIGGGFVAQNLTLEGVGKPSQLEVGDLNNDGYSDLALVDENMVTYAVWNNNGNFTAVDTIRDFGLDVDSSLNLYADVLVRTSGLDEGSVSLPLLTEVTESTSSSAISSDLEAWISVLGASDDFDLLLDGVSEETQTVTKKISQAFEYANHDEINEDFTITKRMTDDNGGRAEVGDSLTFEISVQNTTSGTKSNLYFADTIFGPFDYVSDSLECLNCSEANLDSEIESSGMQNPWIYGPMSLSTGESVNFEYSVTVADLPDVSVMIGENFYDDYPEDEFADLAISLEGNDTGQLMVYYSNGYVEITENEGLLGLGGDTYKRMNYSEKEYSPETYAEEYAEGTEVDNPFEDANEDGIPDFMENMDDELGIPVPSNGYDFIAEVLGGVDQDSEGEEGHGYYSTDEMFSNDDDVDNDGIVDTYDEWIFSGGLALSPDLDLDIPDEEQVVLTDEGTVTLEIDAELNLMSEEVEAVSQKIEEVVAMFTCNGGCLAVPGSIAFLAPGNFHDPFLGTTVGFDLGTPLFGIMPNPSFVCAGQACFATSVFRLYLAPTTTLGLGLGLCLAPYATGQCFAFNLPILDALGVCDAINGFISDTLSKAADFVQDGANQILSVNPETQKRDEPSGLTSAIFDAYTPPVATDINIQIPGFPSIFTEWWKAQKQEFFKMLDLPDIIFRYPDPASFTTEFGGFQEKLEANKANGAVDLDEESRIQAYTSSIMGLENFLNWAHSLPLIDIETERVNIYYPALTEEEIELVKYDWALWVEDANEEWNRFKDQFKLREDITDAQQAAYDEVAEVVAEAISGMEANMAVIESYLKIPEQILALRDIQAYYARIIVCYVDAILSFTAGYLLENVERVQAWIQWIVDLKDIIAGWQALIDLSLDFMSACDKCTNQRWSGLQLLFSLFIFIPDLPVVEMPKLPDIVIDVSHIQAGVDVIWPDINFVPKTINIPELPRFALPSVYLDPNIDLNLTVPVLPEFPILFEFPELPGLPLPDLPSLPPPPSVPSILPSIEAALSIASNILKIICVIRQGFIPTPELMLKSKIEEITQRPGGIVLPFDLALTVEWPSFNFDFLERIEINTYLNLTTDFTLLYDLVNGVGEKSNAFVDDTVDDLNKVMQDFMNQIEAVTMSPGEWEASLELNVEADVDLEEGEASAGGSGSAGVSNGNGSSVGVEGEEGVSTGDDSAALYDQLLASAHTNPALNTALAFEDHPMVQDNLNALVSAMEQVQIEMDAWAETLPEDDIELIATQRILALDDPLLNRYNEVIADDGSDYLTQDFIASISGTPLADLNIMRSSMIAFVDDLEQGTRTLEGLNGTDGFNRYLAQESLSEGHVMLASDDGVDYDPVDSWTPEDAITEDFDLEVELSSESSILADLELGPSPQFFDNGIFINNAELGISTKLIDYTQETDEGVQLLFSDLDGDGDDEVIYSMGGDIYYKENHEESANLRHNNEDPVETTVSEMSPSYGNVKNLSAGSNENEEARFGFSRSNEAIAYHALLYDSMDAQQSAPDENIKDLLLLSQSENGRESVISVDGLDDVSFGGTLSGEEDSDRVYNSESGVEIQVPEGAEFILPQIQDSRLFVESMKGSIELKNAYERLILDSNNELSTSDDVVLQTLEDSLLKITIGENTTNMNVPAHHLLNFQATDERTIRIESGTVAWIDRDTIVDSQDLMEGMEVFKDELVSLESRSAEVTLESSEGAQIELDNETDFVMDQLQSASNPSAQIEIGNGAYYSVIRPLFADGQSGTISENILLNPQICADDSAPFIVTDASGGAVDVAIFSTMEISAEQSFDSDSEILDVYWDLDATIDANGDGDPTNDEEYIGMTAEIGPYDTTEPRVVTVWMSDSAGNESSSEIDVSVYVPEIILESALITQDESLGLSESNDYITGTAEVLGETEPESPNFPFHLVRDRGGSLMELGEGYFTDDLGGIILNDFYITDLMGVYDDNGNVIAEFNPKTRQVLSINENYDVMALAADGSWPARLVVYEINTSLIVASFVIVTEESSTISLFGSSLEGFELSNVENVSIHFIEEDHEFFIETDRVYATTDTGSTGFVLDETGNIAIYDDSFEIIKREADSLEDYLIIEIYKDDELQMEIWPGTLQEVYLVTTETLGLPDSGTINGDSLADDYRLNFEDIADNDLLYNDIAELVERGVLEGEDVNGLQYFYPDRELNRAEFSKIMLGILCIIPSEEAGALPEVFYDVTDINEWYYAYTKEAQLRDFITGYLGEANSAGLAPYKPTASITYAEAAKIMLEALDDQGFIALPDEDALFSEPWYDSYLNIAQDLTPYLTGESTAGESTYILTAEEAADPLHNLSRYEFVELSVRVLQAYNCFELDTDGDGLYNYEEEGTYGTDPYNPDTDSGGVNDGDEVDRGSDPLFGDDDFEGGSLDAEPGVYAVRESCNSCPCASNIDYLGDIQEGDEIFAIIQNDEGSVYGVSNTVTVQEE